MEIGLSRGSVGTSWADAERKAPRAARRRAGGTAAGGNLLGARTESLPVNDDHAGEDERSAEEPHGRNRLSQQHGRQEKGEQRLHGAQDGGPTGPREGKPREEGAVGHDRGDPGQ